MAEEETNIQLWYIWIVSKILHIFNAKISCHLSSHSDQGDKEKHIRNVLRKLQNNEII